MQNLRQLCFKFETLEPSVTLSATTALDYDLTTVKGDSKKQLIASLLNQHKEFGTLTLYNSSHSPLITLMYEIKFSVYSCSYIILCYHASSLHDRQLIQHFIHFINQIYRWKNVYDS